MKFFLYAYVTLWQPHFPLSQSVTPGITPPSSPEVWRNYWMTPCRCYVAVLCCCCCQNIHKYRLSSAAYFFRLRKCMNLYTENFCLFWKRQWVTHSWCRGSAFVLLTNVVLICRYAFPDLTNEQGYWAKAIPEAVAQRGIVLFFFINVGSTDVRFGINDVEVGIFFSGIQTTSPLWALLDLYGSTVAVEFVGMYCCQVSYVARVCNICDSILSSLPQIVSTFRQFFF